MSTPLVILHGWNSEVVRWEPFAAQISEVGYSVYLPKLPGFQYGEPIQQSMNTADYVAWVTNYLVKQRIKTCFLLGHSLGGQIAAQLTVDNPQSVKKLILVNSAGIRPKITFKRLIFTPIAKLGKLIFSNKFLQPLSNSMREILYFAAQESDYFKSSPLLKQTFLRIIQEDQQFNFTKITCPTLIVWGQQDKMTPLKSGRRINQLIAHSQLTVIKDASHSLPFTHVPTLASLVLNFIKQ